MVPQLPTSDLQALKQRKIAYDLRVYGNKPDFEKEELNPLIAVIAQDTQVQPPSSLGAGHLVEDEEWRLEDGVSLLEFGSQFAYAP